ncbi:hypothetical protein HPO_11334 [Hyphomonas polymorpha PS728]|uniref:Uncharacterized protein n=1 Tax=Hyphomonas polymorpha PS728 TaxID=1280954 RepID=A0A062V7S5_9PROT|nr:MULTISPECIES: hypothetical protein [Hyphomonas]KCZ98192.1 hypothetical protein HPO_11334 [Hyphomonas polymorpha PS728]
MRGIASIILAGASAAGTADAAPWVREDGGWYARVLGAHDTLNGADGWRLDLYGEYGVTDKITVTLKNEAVTYPDFRAFDRDTWRLTARRTLGSYKGWTAGAEFGAFHGSTLSGSGAQGLVFCEGTGFEGRVGAGWSGNYRGRPLYAFVDAAHLAQDGGCNRNRIEAGYGQDLSRHIFIGQQVWFEEGEISGRSVKTETQLGVHFGPADVSLGYREEIGGAFNENAVLIAVVMRR